MESVDTRIATLESRQSGLERELHLMGDGIVDIARDYNSKLSEMTQAHLEALKLQANSLSIPLLKDVLVPIVMRLFGFFSMLVLLLLAGIFGIRWAVGDVIKSFSG